MIQERWSRFTRFHEPTDRWVEVEPSIVWRVNDILRVIKTGELMLVDEVQFQRGNTLLKVQRGYDGSKPYRVAQGYDLTRVGSKS